MRRRRCFSLFFFNDTATTEIYTLSLHDALPISSVLSEWPSARAFRRAVSTEITMSPKKFLNSPRDRLFKELPLILRPERRPRALRERASEPLLFSSQGKASTSVGQDLPRWAEFSFRISRSPTQQTLKFPLPNRGTSGSASHKVLS